jgi:two-component system CheB/CheR fusion protein
MYSEAAVRPVSPERLRRYFTHVDGKFRVNKRVREACIFARHDVTRDPPFSRIDLVMCRNVLIYMDTFLQKRLLSAFHYALKPTGFLMLGSAETVGAQSDLFISEDKKHRLYSKRAAHIPPLELGPTDEYEAAARPPLPLVKPLRETVIHKTIQQEANQLVMSKYAPPGVLVNEKLDIVQFRGQTGFFLEPAPGDVSLNVLSMIRPGLLHALQQALSEARKAQAPVRKEALHVAFNSHGRDVNLEVIPILAPDEPVHFLILFEDITLEKAAAGRKSSDSAAAPPATAESSAGELEQLQRELETTRRYLQQTIQDLEVVNEELQSSNEEVLSTNEELQSTNEELDTAKEELQSTNEELNTLNAELHSRNEELNRLNIDLMNLLRSVQLAVIMVDRSLSIRRFTPAAEKLFNLIPTDIGRPLQHLKPNIECPQLDEWIHGVINSGMPLDREIQDVNGKWFALRIWPYSGPDERIEGAVIALVDVDAAKTRELRSGEDREALFEVLESVDQGLAVLDGRFNVQTANSAFCRMCNVAQNDATGNLLFELGGGEWYASELRASLERIWSQGGAFDGFEVEFPAADGGRKKFLLSARRVESNSRPQRLLLTFKEKPAA